MTTIVDICMSLAGKRYKVIWVEHKAPLEFRCWLVKELHQMMDVLCTYDSMFSIEQELVDWMFPEPLVPNILPGR